MLPIQMKTDLFLSIRTRHLRNLRIVSLTAEEIPQEQTPSLKTTMKMGRINKTLKMKMWKSTAVI